MAICISIDYSKTCEQFCPVSDFLIVFRSINQTLHTKESYEHYLLLEIIIIHLGSFNLGQNACVSPLWVLSDL